jgi:hypothetical protein
MGNAATLITKGLSGRPRGIRTLDLLFSRQPLSATNKCFNHSDFHFRATGFEMRTNKFWHTGFAG